jgi:hypothetical protein
MMLADLQRDFQQWLTAATPDAAARIATRVATRVAARADAGAAARVDARADAQAVGGGQRAMAGLAVYQNNYRAQLVGCLEACYPKLHTWLGDELFLAAAITHIDAHPPHAWTLDAYADGFTHTLAALHPHNPDVQEVAWIEHALGAALVAADAAPLALAALSSVDWDTVRLRLTPSLRSIAAATNAEQVWSALWDERAPPESEMLAQQGGLLVWRRGYTSYLKQVDALEYEALLQLQLQVNGSFASLCDWLAARCGEADGVAKAGELLAAWLAAELIISAA